MTLSGFSTFVGDYLCDELRKCDQTQATRAGIKKLMLRVYILNVFEEESLAFASSPAIEQVARVGLHILLWSPLQIPSIFRLLLHFGEMNQPLDASFDNARVLLTKEVLASTSKEKLALRFVGGFPFSPSPI